jgi:FdhD protein
MIHNAFIDESLYMSVPCRRHAGAEQTETALCLTREKIVLLEADGCTLQRFVCSPAQLAELCVGWLCAEGYIRTAGEVEQLHISADGSSAKAVLSALQIREIEPFAACASVDSGLCRRAAAILLESDSVHSKTRGTHGCVFLSKDGTELFCEDIGRNNAMDKVIGSALLQGRDLRRGMLFSSGRVTADIVRKAAHAGIPVLVSKAAVTVDALAAAAQYRLRLAFFADGKCHILSAGI